MPPELSGEYEVADCLKSSEGSSAYLLRRRADGGKYLLKIGELKNKYRVEAEKSAIAALYEKGVGVPAIVGSGVCGDRCYLLREYVEGTTLEELYQTKGGFSDRELIGIGTEICRQLSVLHGMAEPIIHRDIKPQNIVVEPSGELVLIDFDAARRYDGKKQRDTHFFGTEITAAPEQYGFEQTDARTDVYGLGKTLIYLSCGCFDGTPLCKGRLKSLLLESVSLLKKDRPASAESFGRQLEKCGKRLKNRVRRIILSAAAAVCAVSLVVAGAYFAGEYEKSRTVEFGSELLEKAVRQSLCFEDEKPVTYEDLGKVTELKIVGSAIFDRSFTGSYIYMLNSTIEYAYMDEFGQAGDVSDLSLIARMPNLRVLYLSNQNISDISALGGLRLTELVLTDNYISDFSSLSGMTSLKKLYIANNPVQNLDFLRGIASLDFLNVDCCNLDSLEPLENTEISELWALECGAGDDSFGSIAKMKRLQVLSLWNLTDDQIELLKDNSSIFEMNLWGEHGAHSLEGLGKMQSLQVLNMGGNQFTSLEGIGGFPALRRLIIGTGITDYTLLSDAAALYSLDISNCAAVDLSAVAAHPSMRTLYCTEAQEREFLALYPDSEIIPEAIK